MSTVVSVGIVQRSYARCSRSPGFFDDFYTVFLASSEEVRDHFMGVSKAKQKVFIHSGISTILLFAMGSRKSEERLKQIADGHAPGGLDIAPGLYPYWVDAWLTVVSKHDPNYDEELDQAWRDTVQQGIDVFIKSYRTN